MLTLFQTLILDSCFSGRYGRADPRHLVARTIEPADYDEMYLAGCPVPRGRSPFHEVRIPCVFSGFESHVLLAASDSKTQAFEYSTGELTGGVFTRALIRTLRNVQLHRIRYSEVLSFMSISASEVLKQ